MNLNKLIGSLALTALVSAGLSSCSNDMEDYRVSSSLKTVINKAPKIKAYSGEHTWGNANDLAGFAGLTRADESSMFTVTNVTDDWNDVYEMNYGQIKGPNNIFSFLKYGIQDSWVDPDKSGWLKDEWVKARYDNTVNFEVPAYLPEGSTGQNATDKLNTEFGFSAKAGESFTFYPYISGQTDQSHKQIGIFYYDTEGQIHKEIVWDSEVTGYKDGKIDGVTLTFNNDCVFGLYFSGRTHDSYVDNTYYYSLPELNDFPEGGNFTDMKIHAGIVPQDVFGGFYNGTVLLVEDWDDFDFDDFAIFFKEKVTTTTKDELKDGVDTPNNGDNTGDNNGDDNGDNNGDDDSDDNGDDNNGGTDTPTPPVVNGDDHTNEVEVNLGVDTKGETSNGKYNESHLSIHVRSAVDVDMFIPMPLDLICPADDMEIVQKHLAGLSDHGGEFENAQYDEDGKVIMEGGLLSKMTYEIKDAATGRTWTVSINVEYVAGNGNTAHVNCPREINEAGIHIWTEGLEGETELFKYLQETYGDGITFEIWNYYNEESTLDELKENLDKATIDFIGNVLPDFFINAFGEENFKERKDCNVNLVEDKQGDYSYKGEGPHLNASSHNKIYEKTVEDKPYPPVY